MRVDCGFFGVIGVVSEVRGEVLGGVDVFGADMDVVRDRGEYMGV